MVRLTKSVYHPSLMASFLRVVFFCALFILDFDSMCSERDFTQKKVIFIHLPESPILHYLLFAAALSQNCQIAV